MHSIKGIIKNNVGLPVANAIVMVKEGSHEFNDMASVSNDDGEFFISGLEIPGSYVLQIQHNSGTIFKTVNLTTPDAVITINT